MQGFLLFLIFVLSAAWIPATITLSVYGNVHWLMSLVGSFLVIEIGEALLFWAAISVPDEAVCLAAA